MPIGTTNCLCATGFFDDGRSLNCKPCDFSCATCSVSATKCDTCKGNRVNKPACDCPANTYEASPRQNNCVTSPTCGITCATCDLNGCLTCAGNRYGPIRGVCECPRQDNGVSRLILNTPLCSTCQQAVLDAKFADELVSVIVDFAGPLALSDSSLNNSFDLCDRVLDSAFKAKIGVSPSCGISGNLFIITLSSISTVVVGDQVIF